MVLLTPDVPGGGYRFGFSPIRRDLKSKDAQRPCLPHSWEDRFHQASFIPQSDKSQLSSPEHLAENGSASSIYSLHMVPPRHAVESSARRKTNTLALTSHP